MKAIWFVKKGTARLEEDPMPEMTSDSLLLQTVYSGLSNGTERNKLMGGNYGGEYPDRLGYQLVSRVVQCGADVDDFHVGDLVFSGKNSGHVEYHVAKESDLLVKVPEDISPVLAAMLGVASVSWHDARLAEVDVNDRVLITGAGLIGLFALQAVQAMGVTDVTIMDGNPNRMRLADELGAGEIINYRADDAKARLGESAPFSVVFECSGADILDDLIGVTWGDGVLTPFGRIVMVGGRFQVKYNFNAAASKQIKIISASHFDQSDLESVIHSAVQGSIRLKPLIWDVVPIERAADTYERLRENPREMLGTVFDWNS